MATERGTTGWRQKMGWYGFLAPLALVVLFAFIQQLGWFDRLENLTLDQRIRQRVKVQPPPDDRLVFLAIDDKTIEELGRWPFAREVHALLTNLVAMDQPGVLTWDIIFDQPNTALSQSATEDSGRDVTNDEVFLASIQAATMPVITGATSQFLSPDQTSIDPGIATRELGRSFPLPPPPAGTLGIPSQGNLILPMESLREVSMMGFVNADPGSDGIIRRVPIFVKVGDKLFPSLAFSSLITYWKLDPGQIRIVPGDAVYIDNGLIKRRIPIDDEGFYQINYRYEANDFTSIPYSRTIAGLSDKYNQADPNAAINLRSKILLVGQNATGLSDMGPSPINPQSGKPLVHLNVMDNILKEDYLRHPSPWAFWISALLVFYLSLLVLLRAGFATGLAVPLLVIALYIGSAFYVFNSSSMVLPVTAPCLAFLLLHAGWMIREVIRERQARRKLSSAFSAYLSPQLLSVISQRLDSTMMSGATKDVTILFSDLRGFTAMTGKTDSRALVAQLNEYFTEMVDCINRNDGSVHKFIGDAIMAAWGDITSAGAQQETIKSLRAGLAMGQALKKLNTLWESQGRAKLGMGIGINFGNVVVGDIGAPQRHEFTVIGDAVNVASRLEGANKLFGTEILVGESVHSLASEFFVFRELGLVKLAGKDKGAPLYELVAEIGRENESRYPADWLKVYHEAYRSLRARRYDVAIRLFEACLREIPGDVACLTYLDTARGLAENPPPADWIPVLEALSK